MEIVTINTMEFLLKNSKRAFDIFAKTLLQLCEVDFPRKMSTRDRRQEIGMPWIDAINEVVVLLK